MSLSRCDHCEISCEAPGETEDVCPKLSKVVEVDRDFEKALESSAGGERLFSLNLLVGAGAANTWPMFCKLCF